MKTNKKIIAGGFIFVAILLAQFCLSLSLPIAQADDALWNAQQGLGTSDQKVGAVFGNQATDVRVIAAQIGLIFFGFLGTIFLIYIIVNGWRYMTAGGDEEQVKKAVTSIQRAAIGLLIILAAWAITRFVLHAVLLANNQVVF